MKCRQGNHQLDNQSVRLGGRQAGRQAGKQAVSQYDSLSVNHALNQYVIHLFHMPFHQAIKLQHVTCQLHISSAKTASTWCPCQYVYQATPMPQQLEPPLPTAAAGAAATKVNQMSAEPPLRFNGADVVCHFGTNVIPNTQTQSFPLPPPAPPPLFHPPFTDDTWQYANVTFVSSQIRQNVDNFLPKHFLNWILNFFTTLLAPFPARFYFSLWLLLEFFSIFSGDFTCDKLLKCRAKMKATKTELRTEEKTAWNKTSSQPNEIFNGLTLWFV